MCVHLDGTEDLEAVATVFRARRTVEELSSELVRPTDRAPTLLLSEGERRLGWTRWGWNVPDPDPKKRPKLQLHARIESAHWRPLWRHSFERQRCAVVAAGWWEVKEVPGQKRGTPYYYTAGEPVALAALWRREGEVARFALVTTDPTPELAAFHDRMPVVLAGDGLDRWLNPLASRDGFADLGRAPAVPVRAWQCLALDDQRAA